MPTTMLASAVLPILLVAGFSVADDVPPTFATEAPESSGANRGLSGGSSVVDPPMQYSPITRQADPSMQLYASQLRQADPSMQLYASQSRQPEPSTQYASKPRKPDLSMQLYASQPRRADPASFAAEPQVQKAYDYLGINNNVGGDPNFIRHPSQYNTQLAMAPQMMAPSTQFLQRNTLPYQNHVPGSSTHVSVPNYDLNQPQVALFEQGNAMSREPMQDNCINCMTELDRKYPMDPPDIYDMHVEPLTNTHRKSSLTPTTSRRPKSQTIWG